MRQRIQAVRGMRDMFAPELRLLDGIVARAAATARMLGYVRHCTHFPATAAANCTGVSAGANSAVYAVVASATFTVAVAAESVLQTQRLLVTGRTLVNLHALHRWKTESMLAQERVTTPVVEDAAVFNRTLGVGVQSVSRAARVNAGDNELTWFGTSRV